VLGISNVLFEIFVLRLASLGTRRPPCSSQVALRRHFSSPPLALWLRGSATAPSTLAWHLARHRPKSRTASFKRHSTRVRLQVEKRDAWVGMVQVHRTSLCMCFTVPALSQSCRAPYSSKRSLLSDCNKLATAKSKTCDTW
jgi:hypothetical protein